MVLIDGNGIPTGTLLSTASRNDVRLIEELVETRTLRRKIKRLIYDKAADSDPLRGRLSERGIEPDLPSQAWSQTPADPGMEERSSGTEKDGKWKEPSLGFIISVES